MAKEVIERLVDDLDGSDADESVEFALDNRLYAVDLNAANADKLRELLAPYVEVATPGPSVRAALGGSALQAIRGRRSARQPAAANGASASDVREWARAQGLQVSDRGRIHRDVQAAYDAAH